MPMYPHIFATLLAIARFQGIAARYNGFRHEALDASKQQHERRQNPIVFNITQPCLAPSPTRSIYSIVFPSPNASPIEITEQSQIITSFLPEMTWCVGPPVALLAIPDAPYLNQSTEYQATFSGSESCETVYVPTVTTVCATTLTAIASKVTVTDCDQEITFSSERGYSLETPTPATTTSNYSLITPAPTIKQMITYFLAPWQSLTAGEVPSDVDIKICTVLDDGELECIRYQEVWEVVVVTQTVTTSRDIQLTTTVTGPGTLMIETMDVIITDTIETVDLSTTMLLEKEIETESTSKGSKLVTRSNSTVALPTSTLYITKHLKYKTTGPEPTTTLRITSIATQNVGTVTWTRPRPRPTFLELPNF